jgi:hypothetical protein
MEEGSSQSEGTKDEPEADKTVKEITDEWRSNPGNWPPPPYRPLPSKSTYWFRRPWVWWLGSGITVLILGLRLAVILAPGHPAPSTSNPPANQGQVAPTGHVKVTSNGVCDGKGLATLTDTPANRAVGLPPLQRVSIRDQGQNVTMVFTFQSAPPQTIPGASSYAFFTDVGSGVTNTEGHSTLIVASGGTQLQPGWTVAVTPPGGSIATTSTAVVDDSTRSLTASFSVPGLSIPFLWSTDETISPNSDPSASYALYVCPSTPYSG